MSHNVEHPRRPTRRITAGLTLAGAGAAAAFALTATSPAANADNAELPTFPDTVGLPTGQESFSLPPFLEGLQFDSNATYTDLLGVTVTTQEPGQWAIWEVPGALPVLRSPGDFPPDIFHGESVLGDVDGVLAPFNGGSVGADTFGYTDTSPGLFNLYEVTPMISAAGAHVLNLDDALVFDPTGNPFSDPSGIEFGIQYLDLPGALTPVDEVNLLGPAGEILFSLPVTGDLFGL